MKKLLLAGAMATFSMAAYAQTIDFTTADANGDGVVTMEEAMAVLPSVSPDTLKGADTDGDGVLSPQEYEALASQ